jgi:hypothetical protein
VYRNGSAFFLVWCCEGRVSEGYGFRILQNLILIDVQKEKEEEMVARVLLCQGQTQLAVCAAWDFHVC